MYLSIAKIRNRKWICSWKWEEKNLHLLVKGHGCVHSSSYGILHLDLSDKAMTAPSNQNFHMLKKKKSCQKKKKSFSHTLNAFAVSTGHWSQASENVQYLRGLYRNLYTPVRLMEAGLCTQTEHCWRAREQCYSYSMWYSDIFVVTAC